MSAKSSPQRETFSNSVADLYRNLYDLVYLRTHPVADALVSGNANSQKERGWEVHKLLLDMVEHLCPGPEVPAFSLPWRRYHLMLSRYVHSLSPDDVARELAISRRQFFREQKQALEFIADLLWSRLANPDAISEEIEASTALDDQASLERPELLRAEATRVKRASRHARVEEVTSGVIAIMQEVLDRKHISLEQTLATPMPAIAMAPCLLRQMLLGAFGYLTARASNAAIQLNAAVQGETIRLAVALASPAPACDTNDCREEDPLAALEEMAALSQAHVSRCYTNGEITGFDITLPLAKRTVLVLDDNRDVVELLKRYLEASNHRVITATRADEALRLAKEVHPDVVILDLMMPHQDGWDVLQTLLHQPETQDIPVIVCSVLKQRALALSLGASEYLEKPVDMQRLVATLQALS